VAADAHEKQSALAGGSTALPTRRLDRPALNGRLLIPHIRRSQDMDDDNQPLITPYLSGLAHSIIGIARPVRPAGPGFSAGVLGHLSDDRRIT
jgi:hypothetical protein